MPAVTAADAGRKKPVLSGGNIVVVSGLLIGLAYGAIGLLSGFCLLSGLRGWWADGDSRLVRTYALALGVAIAAAQLLDVVIDRPGYATINGIGALVRRIIVDALD